MQLVDLSSIAPNILIDLRYATKDNFTGKVIYDFKRCFLIEKAALALDQVQKELEPYGLGLKVWDGYRPIAAQWKLWEICPDERYVSDPKKGGRHTRGTAVDLTLVTKTGQELPMPTPFDDFSEKAHRDYPNASVEEIKNRDFLRKLMEKHGFASVSTEWWHFDLIGWQQVPPIEIQNA